MDRLDQAVTALKAESKRLEQQLQQVRSAIAALRSASSNGRGMTASRAGRTMPATAAKKNRSRSEGTLGGVEGGTTEESGVIAQLPICQSDYRQ
jgi:ABC-type transporter Mla subunit MlaD